MRAITLEKYGSPDVLMLKAVEKPTPNDDQVLIKIHAAGANPADWHFIRGAPIIARIEFGLMKPRIKIPGNDFAGTVEAIGANVTQFKPGDAVFGESAGSRLSAFAEYICTTEAEIVHKPENISFEAAAAIPIPALTALQGLRDTGKIKAGQSVLINGASGGVGTFAVQIAKAFGAEVTGVCSTRNLDMVRSIGADHVVDYTKEDFTRQGKQYDLIFDCVGNRTASAFARALKPDGICSVAGFTTMPHMLTQTVLMGALISLFSSKKIGSMGTAKTNKPDLLVLYDMLASGQVVPVIDRCYPFSETAEAIRYLEQGHARGKVVINVI